MDLAPDIRVDQSNSTPLTDTGKFAMTIDSNPKPQTKEDRGHNESKFNSFNRLPFETIAYIFEHYVNEMASCPWLPQRGAFPIGAVCALWRHIAWTHPPLWNSFVFILEKNTKTSKVELAIEWLKRSGGLPLSISIHSLEHPPKNEPLTFPLIDVINLVLSRCRHLDLYQLTSVTFSRFSQVKGPSLIQSLRLCPAEINTPLDLGPQAGPTALNIAGVHLELLVINWNNLTHFCAWGLYLHEVLDALLLAPRITTCEQSSIANSDSMPLKGYRAMVHSQLNDLQFFLNNDTINSEVMTAFFQQSTFPNLKHCRLYTRHTFPTNAFATFLSRSACSIVNLDIHCASIMSEDLIKTARLLPSITSLSLFDSFDPDASSLNGFFNALCHDSRYIGHDSVFTGAVLFPSLQSLTVLRPTMFPWEWIPGFRDKRSFNETSCTITPVRPHLTHITISRTFYITDNAVPDDELYTTTGYLPCALIGSWESFLELLELQKSVTLHLEVRNADGEYSDLFGSSFLKLKAIHGDPPEHIRAAESLHSWIAQSHEDADHDFD